MTQQQFHVYGAISSLAVIDLFFFFLNRYSIHVYVMKYGLFIRQAGHYELKHTFNFYSRAKLDVIGVST